MVLLTAILIVLCGLTQAGTPDDGLGVYGGTPDDGFGVYGGSVYSSSDDEFGVYGGSVYSSPKFSQRSILDLPGWKWREGLYFNANGFVYLRGLVTLGICGVILSAFICVFSIIFFSCRFMFNSCGKSTPRQTGYSKSEQRNYVMALYVISFLIGGGLIISVVSSSMIGHSIRQTISYLENAIATLHDVHFQINNSVTSTNDEILVVADKVTEIIQFKLFSLQHSIFWINTLRCAVVSCTVTLAVIGAGLGFIGGYSMRHYVTFWMGIVCFMAAFIAILSVAISLPLSVLISESCDTQLPLFTFDSENQTDEQTSQIFESAANGTYNMIIQHFVVLKKNVQNSYGPNTGINLGIPLVNFNSSKATVMEIDHRLKDIVGELGVYLTKNNKTITHEVSNAINETKIGITLFAYMFQLINCEMLFSFTQSISLNVCQNLELSSRYHWIGLSFIAIFCFVGGFVGFKASKRFMRSIYGETGSPTERDQLYHSGDITDYSNFEIIDMLRQRQRHLETQCRIQALIGMAHLALYDWENSIIASPGLIITFIGAYTIVPIIGFFLVGLRHRQPLAVFSFCSLGLLGCVSILFYLHILGLSRCLKPDVQKCVSMYEETMCIIGMFFLTVEIIVLVSSLFLSFTFTKLLEEKSDHKHIQDDHNTWEEDLVG